MTTDGHFHVSTDDVVAALTLDNPAQRKAPTPGLCRALIYACEVLGQDPKVAVDRGHGGLHDSRGYLAHRDRTGQAGRPLPRPALGRLVARVGPRRPKHLTLTGEELSPTLAEKRRAVAKLLISSSLVA
ncbi:hypothetical protein [Micrococcus yunnanensis]|uniref:hypothetical protein n=1 Tax=Micrococcus yunnanensis TaxID=566027 RepID=UPI00398EBA2B